MVVLPSKPNPHLADAIEDLLTLPERAAPEKVAELRLLLKELGLSIQFDESATKILIRADAAHGRIIIGAPCMKRLLATVVAYTMIYKAVSSAAGGAGADFAKVLSSPDGAKALALLKWTIREEVDNALLPDSEKYRDAGPDAGWPDHIVPFPDPNGAETSVGRMAIEFFYMALAVLLFHELAHIKLGHSKAEGAANVEQELGADREAARWLMEGITHAHPSYTKRTVGLALAFLWTASLTLHGIQSNPDNYPHGFNRLHHRLAEWTTDADGMAWAMTASIAALHLAWKGHPIGDDTFANFQRAADALTAAAIRVTQKA